MSGRGVKTVRYHQCGAGWGSQGAIHLGLVEVPVWTAQSSLNFSEQLG